VDRVNIIGSATAGSTLLVNIAAQWRMGTWTQVANRLHHARGESAPDIQHELELVQILRTEPR
jgi:hypothetical protein